MGTQNSDSMHELIERIIQDQIGVLNYLGFEANSIKLSSHVYDDMIDYWRDKFIAPENRDNNLKIRTVEYMGLPVIEMPEPLMLNGMMTGGVSGLVHPVLVTYKQ